jgi:uncharacterized protein YlxW (UPF0749 family)
MDDETARPGDESPSDATTEFQAQETGPDDYGAADLRRRKRASKSGAAIGLLLGLLGFGLVVQVRSNNTDTALDSARPEDLVRILSDLDSRKERLNQEIGSLQDTQRQLANSSQGSQAAQQEAKKRADSLGILAGTLKAQGPGLVIRLDETDGRIHARTVLDAIEELRGAGAEAMQIGGGNGKVVRIVAATYFLDGTDGIISDGQPLTAPYSITVIGDPQTMQTALNIPGGVADTVRHDGGTVIVQQPGTVQVTALHEVTPPKYAQPST